MASESDARALCRTYLAYRALGGASFVQDGFRIVRQDAAPLVHDVNHVQVPVDGEVEGLMARVESTFSDRAFRQVCVTPFTSPGIEARLSHEGYAPDPTLQGLLSGALRGREPVAVDIRPVLSKDDWRHLDRLVRFDHVESGEKPGGIRLSEEVTRQIQHVRRRCADEVHFFMAWHSGEPVAFFSSWPGVGGVGMVEDLFTLPEYRNQGFARALIHHCVDDARARGAGSVLIGSEPKDTPKEIYRAMGFEPNCLTWNWLKTDVV